jgi:hypothetical protein
MEATNLGDGKHHSSQLVVRGRRSPEMNPIESSSPDTFETSSTSTSAFSASAFSGTPQGSKIIKNDPTHEEEQIQHLIIQGAMGDLAVSALIPVISYGVLHENRLILPSTTVTRDPRTEPLTDPIFPIGELTALFTTTMVEDLIRRNQIHREDKVAYGDMPSRHQKKKGKADSRLKITVGNLLGGSVFLPPYEQLLVGEYGKPRFSHSDVKKLLAKLDSRRMGRDRPAGRSPKLALEALGSILHDSSMGRTLNDCFRYSIGGGFKLHRSYYGTRVSWDGEPGIEVRPTVAGIIVGQNPRVAEPVELKPPLRSARDAGAASMGARSCVTDLLEVCGHLMRCRRDAKLAHVFDSAVVGFERSEGEKMPRRLALTAGLAVSIPEAATYFVGRSRLPGTECVVVLVPETQSAVVLLANRSGPPGSFELTDIARKMLLSYLVNDRELDVIDAEEKPRALRRALLREKTWIGIHQGNMDPGPARIYARETLNLRHYVGTYLHEASNSVVRLRIAEQKGKLFVTFQPCRKGSGDAPGKMWSMRPISRLRWNWFPGYTQIAASGLRFAEEKEYYDLFFEEEAIEAQDSQRRELKLIKWVCWKFAEGQYSDGFFRFKKEVA